MTANDTGSPISVYDTRKDYEQAESDEQVLFVNIAFVKTRFFIIRCSIYLYPLLFLLL
jgi:hypothetical protein